MSRVFLVTGSNSGIGFELVRHIAQKGHTVYLAARNEAAGKEAQCVFLIGISRSNLTLSTRSQLVKEGLNVKFVQLDISSPPSIKAAVQTIDEAEGKLDVLVNNAGTLSRLGIDISVPTRPSFRKWLYGSKSKCSQC
jgi:NAD(P)-dependent dehydrogenase (short-subunit alcohol dehydrogenase family)